MSRSYLAGAALAAVCAAGALARAQETTVALESGATEPVQTVVTRGVRDPAMAPYAKVHETLDKVRKVADGRVDLHFRVVSAASQQPIPDLEITLQGDTTHEPVAISPDGVLTMPFDAKYVADHAVFLSNKKEGSLRAEYYLLPVLPRERMTYGDMAASVAAGRRAVAEMLPWYIRLLGGSIHGVTLCYPDSGQQVIVANNTVPPRPANGEQPDALTKRTVHCAFFEERELKAAPDTVVAPAPGWIAQYH